MEADAEVAHPATATACREGKTLGNGAGGAETETETETVAADGTEAAEGGGGLRAAAGVEGDWDLWRGRRCSDLVADGDSTRLHRRSATATM
ncbi:hypothetical protein OsI_12263 [Oryza sativa Indica Group]|uniref:Uncharacterized protein n=1 Tax=Oryza sativa subsp. indica TaxID=39946 RepID=A2XIK1_ORYSI|nr:hypothetical protein OsI_12263 [Oryza sativa Indica Group]